jgi:uncharacterized protein (DUF302 family)
MRRAAAARLTAMVSACALLWGAAAGAGESGRIELTDEFLVLKVRGPLAEVLAALETAIARRNYFFTGTNNVDDNLRQRAAHLGGSFAFEHYKVVSFCNLTLANEALAVEPYVGAFMPCRLAVFAPKGSHQITIVTVRPTYLSRSFKSSEFRQLATRVEADVVAILEMVAADLP